MLVIDKYKMAYLHINKTAGISIRSYLTTLAGAQNVKQMGPTHGLLSSSIRFMGSRFYNYKILVSIRNPFARVVSIYLFRSTRYEQGDVSPTTTAAYEMPFKQWFMEVIVDSQRLTDLSITDSLLINGKLPENVYIVSVETIDRDLNIFCRDVLGLNITQRLLHLNKTKFARDHYTKYIDDELLQAIYEWDQWIIDEFYPWAI